MMQDSDHYFKNNYDSKGRFNSYWHQIQEVIKLNPDSVLEIGRGNGFVSTYLKECGVHISTLDIDVGLNPDIAASVEKIPIKNKAFEVVTCFQALEHLPYTMFESSLKELARVSRKYVIVSLPDINRAYRFNIKIPVLKEIKTQINFPPLSNRSYPTSKEHCWEIGMEGYPLKKISVSIENVGFVIEKTYRVFECPYHRFFILKKS